MDAFLGSITQHAMNYAIRSGIAITSTYTIRQCTRLLKAVEDKTDYQELQNLQERLQNKTMIIDPAIDMIELISAKGNTTLGSAVTLTKGLRWDIQSLGIRLSKAANVEELSRRDKTGASSNPELKAELRLIVQDIRKLLLRIDDAVPLINLAITTSGATLSTSLPPTVSPSRLLQASTCLTTGDNQFSLDPFSPVQIGPAFVLSIYMLFTGHTTRSRDKEGDIRHTTWKEIIHKARVKLIRVPSNLQRPSLETLHQGPTTPSDEKEFSNLIEKSSIGTQETHFPLESHESQFEYYLELVEDLDDGRVHSFEDGELQPEPYEDIPLAGIREFIPIYQFSKILYADTGRILNISTDSDMNSPVLLLKRDVNAQAPRQMMKPDEREFLWSQCGDEDNIENDCDLTQTDNDKNDSQADVDQQLHSEGSIHLTRQEQNDQKKKSLWRFPVDLDPEWMALEVYAESEYNSSDEDTNDDSNDSPRSSRFKDRSYHSSLDESFEKLHIDTSTPRFPSTPEVHQFSTPVLPPMPSIEPVASSLFGPVRSSLSLLDMLIRLTALQQFKQTSHLAIPDELLNFFLHESSTSGAGGDGEQRRRTRYEAKQKVGFDPYDDTPIKPRETLNRETLNSQYSELYPSHSRGGTPYSEYDARQQYYDNEYSRGFLQSRSGTPQDSPDKLILRNSESSSQSRRRTSPFTSSPVTPHIPQRAVKPLEFLRQTRHAENKISPLRRGGSVETDSSLGTSPGTRATPIVGDKNCR